MTSLVELQKIALALRKQILDELEAEVEESSQRFQDEVEKAKKARREAEEAARQARHDARTAVKAARLAAQASLAPRIRKRAPGANYEISGYPAHLARGSTYRRVEGSRRHSPNTMVTRSQAKKIGSISAHTRKNRR